MKEFIIILIILAIIIGGAIFIQKYLDKTSQELVSDLRELKHQILAVGTEDERTEIKENVNKIYDRWENIEKKWAIIVLHSELDLIETSFVRMKSGIEEGDLDRSLEELETNLFLIDHIRKKEMFCLKNIF